jgi:ketosteroid isomerase-like protein
MSANLDLVRSIYADWERGDWGQSDWIDPQMELVVADGPDRQNLTGHEQIRSRWREFLGTWSGYTVVADEFRELSVGRILVLVHATGQGRTSGVGLSHGDQGANVFDVADGRVTRLVTYFDRSRAFADLGLTE